MNNDIATIKKASVQRMWRLKVYDVRDEKVVHDDIYDTEKDAKEVIWDNVYGEDCYEVSLEEEDIINEASLDKAIKMALKSGITDGLTRYAWWKEGTQYVGSCGNTLRQALEDVDKEFGD